MFFWSRPSPSAIAAFLAGLKNQRFSYDEVGRSRGEMPSGYTVDHNRVRLGTGAEVFERAKSAIRLWKMFDLSWVNLCWPGTHIEPGAVVASLMSHLGFWSLNGCRIVYLIEERGTTERFGFAYGTLLDHAEIGEERFLVEFNPEHQEVWYDIRAFSRPRTLARLGYPITRGLQRRFVRDSKAAMLRAVRS